VTQITNSNLNSKKKKHVVGETKERASVRVAASIAKLMCVGVWVCVSLQAGRHGKGESVAPQEMVSQWVSCLIAYFH
jgi:hypothetical protein